MDSIAGEGGIDGCIDPHFGDSLVHTGPSAAKACEDINARAFTVGNHVAFNTGEYDPSSAEGQHILAHELAHVRQQTGGAVSMLPQPGELEIDPDERLEREAEETAERVMSGGELGIQRMRDSEVHIQRLDKETVSNYLSFKKGNDDISPETADQLAEQTHEVDSQAFRSGEQGPNLPDGVTQQDLDYFTALQTLEQLQKKKVRIEQIESKLEKKKAAKEEYEAAAEEYASAARTDDISPEIQAEYEQKRTQLNNIETTIEHLEQEKQDAIDEAEKLWDSLDLSDEEKEHIYQPLELLRSEIDFTGSFAGGVLDGIKIIGALLSEVAGFGVYLQRLIDGLKTIVKLRRAKNKEVSESAGDTADGDRPDRVPDPEGE